MWIFIVITLNHQKFLLYLDYVKFNLIESFGQMCDKIDVYCSCFLGRLCALNKLSNTS